MFRAKAFVRLRLFLLAVLLLAGMVRAHPLQTGPPDPKTLWALVIGVSNYSHAEPLKYAATDAFIYGEFLRSLRGGGVPPDHIYLLLEDRATRANVLQTLEELQEKVQPGDTVYVYLAGHGYTKGRIGYFIPSDGHLESPAASSINFSHLKEMVEAGLAHSKLRLLITDICNAGRIGPNRSELAARIQNLVNEELMKVNAGGGAFINLLASRPTEASWERDDLGHGVFTHTLMEALNGKAATPGETVASARGIVDFVLREVPKYTANQQHPMVNESFDPSAPLAFLDRPGPSTARPTLTTLTVTNLAQKAVSRIEWVDPNSRSKVVRPVPKEAPAVSLGVMAPGELELRFFDAADAPQPVRTRLAPGPNTLDAATGSLAVDAAAGPVQVAALGLAGIGAAQIQTAAALPESSVLLRVNAGTRVVVDGVPWGTADAANNLLQLRGLAPGIRQLVLHPSADREQRFRLRLFPGPHAFDSASAELRFLGDLPPAPSNNVPQGVPANLADTYRRFELALWEERIVQPAGTSAWDEFTRLRDAVPAALRESLSRRIAVAMGDRAQRTILRYIRGGDIRWSSAVFDEGALLIERMRQLVRPIPESQADELFFRGRSLIEQSRYPEAVLQLQQALAVNPEASHAQNAIGLAFWKQNLFAQAIPALEAAIALSPEWNYPRMTLALILLEQRRYVEAEQAFRAVLQNNTEDSTARHGLGQLYLLLNRLGESEAELLRAVEFNPGNGYAYNTWGRLNQRRDRLDDAEQMYRLAIRLEPDEPAFHVSLAELLRARGRMPEAQAVFARVAGQAGANLIVLQAYTNFLHAQNRTAEARSVFETAVRRFPRDANIRVLRGAFLQRTGRAGDAERELREAVRLAPANAFAHHELANVYLAARRVPDAERQLGLAAQADPRFGAPPRLLGQIRFAQRRYDDALVEYRRALDLSIDAAQQQEIRELIAEAERAGAAAAVTAAGAAAGRDDTAAWRIQVDALRASPRSTAVRDAILQFQNDRPGASDIALLPDAPVSAVLRTAFWRSQLLAETQWRSGRRAEGMTAFSAALEALTEAERRLVSGTPFNLRNERHSIHERIYQWAVRMIEERRPADARRLMGTAIERHVFATVPGLSTITIDSLMWPEDVASASSFTDYEVARHPDRRPHEILAALAALDGPLDRAREYLAALETPAPDPRARVFVADALIRESRRADALLWIEESLTKLPGNRELQQALERARR